MSININTVKVLCYNLAAKQQAAFPSPAEFNSYAELSNIDLFNYYNDEYAKMLLELKQGITLDIPRALLPFVINNEALISTAPSTGVWAVPTVYLYDLAYKTPFNGINHTIKKVDFDRVESYLNSTIDYPTLENPILVETNTAIQVYPVSASPVFLSYIRKPSTPFWQYTLVNNRPVYTPLGSVDFEFPDTELLRVSSRILGYMGISIRDDMLAKEANLLTQTSS